MTNHFLYGALDATAAENRARREPPLCVSMVNKTGKPGRGYFQKHAFLSGNEDPFADAVFARHLAVFVGRVRTDEGCDIAFDVVDDDRGADPARARAA